MQTNKQKNKQQNNKQNSNKKANNQNNQIQTNKHTQTTKKETRRRKKKTYKHTLSENFNRLKGYSIASIENSDYFVVCLFRCLHGSLLVVCFLLVVSLYGCL